MTNAEIRTFRAANTRAALAAIKAALGSEAIILETREVGGLFGKREVEVTVAPPAEGTDERRDATGRASSRATGPRAVVRPAFLRGPEREDTASVEEASLQAAHALLSRRAARAFARDALPAETESVDGARTSFDDRSNEAAPSSARADLQRRLLRCGIDEDLVFALLRDADPSGPSSLADLEQEVETLLRRRLPCIEAPWLAPRHRASGPRHIAVVGPTGVGKTTTVAKIAARALLDSQLKVALVTVDGYRIGASDQLARYGKIMGVPTYVARDESALSDALVHARGADLVLVDTAGRSDEAARAAQTQLLQSVPDLEIALALSAATGGRELRAMARRYAPLAPRTLIFTKLDEADGPGSLLTALDVLPRPVSCVTDGQRVPEDIHPVNAQALARRVLRKPEAA